MIRSKGFFFFFFFFFFKYDFCHFLALRTEEEVCLDGTHPMLLQICMPSFRSVAPFLLFFW